MPRFDLPEFLRITAEHRCNWLFIAPPIAVALAKHPIVDDYDLSSVNVIFSGAAPLAGPSEPGELLVRGPQVMTGYLGNPEATAETLDADGWLHTGDLATVDADGVYRIVDRLKELIKYKGYQVAPAVLEAILLEHPGIADGAVIGVSDADGQEIPRGFVVLQPGAILSEQEVIAFVAGRVAPHEKVREIRFISAIPKSTAGKILRRELRGHP